MFSERLKELRQKNNLTQEELGKKINLKKAAISKYENNKLQPNIDILIKLSTIFNVSIDYLTGKTDTLISIESNEIDITIDNDLNNIEKKLLSFNNVSYHGKYLNEISRSLILNALQHTKEIANISIHSTINEEK